MSDPIPASRAWPGPSSVEAEPPIKTYFIPALFATILGFPVTGLMAMAEAVKAKNLIEQGDRAGAIAASNRARRLVVWSIVLGVLLVGGTILVATIGGLALRDYLMQQAQSGGI